MKRVIAMAALLAAGCMAGPASAQFYGPGYERPQPYGYGPPRGEYRDDDYARPRRRYRDDDMESPRGYRGGARFGGTCVTARGACPTARPLPRNSSCACEIPGFGYKRGAVN